MLKSLVLQNVPHDARRRLYAWRHSDYYNHLQAKRTSEKNGYSFAQFDRTRSIYIHIPKAAGLSVCHSLYGNRAGGHARLDEFEIAYSRRDIRNYFTFTFVRNPWDRLHSAYVFLKNGGICDLDREFGQSLPDTFQDFVMTLTPEFAESQIHFVPQCRFLQSRSGRDLAVDFIGRFESLKRDFDYVRRRVNPAAKLEHKNKTQNSQDYRQAYTPAMVEKAAAIYARDITLLKYSFE